MAERPKVPNELLYRGINRLAVRPIAKILGGITVHNLGGHEPIPGAFMKVSNHPSGRLDAPINGSVQLERDGSTMHAIATSSLITNKVNGWVYHNLGSLFIDRDEKTIDPNVISYIESVFDNNGIIFTFPEGHTTHSKQIKKPKRNVVALAVNAGVPIEVNAISGTAPGDIGNFHYVIGAVLPIKKEPVDMREPRSIVAAAQPYMSDLYDAMNDALQDAHRLRAEYTAEHPIPSDPVARFLIEQLSQEIPQHITARAA
jgi:1-acyl-sn-glycerol-3-phosphate acyltransferase